MAVAGTFPDVRVAFFGGMDSAERKRALIHPSEWEPAREDFQISLFEIHYSKKFAKIRHADVLGSLTGLGVKREKYGDILMAEGRVQFFAAAEIADFLRFHFNHVGKMPVTLAQKSPDEVLPVREEWDVKTVTVSSLRLDAVLAAATAHPRKKIQADILHGAVKVNWTPVDEGSLLLEEGDVISYRGFGRLKLLEIGGRTKKGKWRILAGRIK